MEASDDGCVIRNRNRLRKGHTTGSCAAAAAAAATEMLFHDHAPSHSSIVLPNGDSLNLPVSEHYRDDLKARCAVRKDAGDDPDVTDGYLVYAEVELSEEEGIRIEGGEGIGRVTRKGLDQAVGEHAINSVPRRMIADSVASVLDSNDHRGGAKVVVSIPGGERIAQRTFNPRLGIEGGLSILCTTGIVEPMSESAIIETVKAEMNIQIAEGVKHLLVTPGNYGASYVSIMPELQPDRIIKCSNFIGETIDHASHMGAESLLIVGNMGKLVKLAAGIMNTHSRYADGRMEVIASHAAMAGASKEDVTIIMGCLTTDDALEVLTSLDLLQDTIESIMDRVGFHLYYRAGPDMKIGAVVHSSKFGLLGTTDQAAEIMTQHGGGS